MAAWVASPVAQLSRFAPSNEAPWLGSRARNASRGGWDLSNSPRPCIHVLMSTRHVARPASLSSPHDWTSRPGLLALASPLATRICPFQNAPEDELLGRYEYVSKLLSSSPPRNYVVRWMYVCTEEYTDTTGNPSLRSWAPNATTYDQGASLPTTYLLNQGVRVYAVHTYRGPNWPCPGCPGAQGRFP